MNDCATSSKALRERLITKSGCSNDKGTDPSPSETSLFSLLIGTLKTDDLLIADRFYTTFAIMALLQKQGTTMLFRQRSNVKTDFRQGRRLGTKDHIIAVKKPKRKPVWISDKQWLELPEDILVQEFSVEGIVYVTSLLEAKKFPKQGLAQLYQQRWKVELDFRSIKTHMGMEMLRCKNADRVEKEIAVHLLAYNLIRANLAKAACINQNKPRNLSFMATVQLIRNTANLCLTLTGNALRKFILPLIQAMTETEIGGRIRPSQPRVVKRRPKAYPMMTKPRNEY